MDDVRNPPPELACKQVVVVRHDLNMRKGKIAAQVAHASMAALIGPQGKCLQNEPEMALHVPLDVEAYSWLAGRFKKICVYVKSEESLLALHKKAVEQGVRCALIQDSGLTEFGGVPTFTALAVGPAMDSRVDAITAGLPLL